MAIAGAVDAGNIPSSKRGKLWWIIPIALSILMMAQLFIMRGAHIVEVIPDFHYFNSDESMCDGTDSTVLFCEDFEREKWAVENCNAPGFFDNPDNGGWCMNIFWGTYPDPTGQDYARAGGAVGTGFAGTSFNLTCPPGFFPKPDVGCIDIATETIGATTARIQGTHLFAPNRRVVTEIYFRYYIKQLPGFIMGHEKVLQILDDNSGFQSGILSKRFGGGFLQFINGNEDTWLFQNSPAGGGGSIKLVNDRWFYVDFHVQHMPKYTDSTCEPQWCK